MSALPSPNGRRLMVALFVAVILVAWPKRIAAESSPDQPVALGLKLPTLARCEKPAAPELPLRWRASALMTPFTTAQIDVGEFVYDGAVPALRASVYGLESGAADLLVTDDATYLLSGPHEEPTGCVSIGRQFTPSARWLSTEAQCAGIAPVLDNELEWWRTPAPDHGARWFWYKSRSRLPWRTMMPSASREPAVIGAYAMTQFAKFEAIPQTTLSRLLNFCRRQARSALGDTFASAREIMEKHADPAAEAERPARIQSLVPGISREDCGTVREARWPRQFAMTAIMLASPFEEGPFPGEVFYDWDDANTQRTRLYDPHRPAAVAASDAFLKGDVGYDVRRDESGDLSCKAIYPGIVKPDWMHGNNCGCKAVIRNNPALAPRAGVEIRACSLEPSRAFWIWQTIGGPPITFRSTIANPGGLILADYYDWMPDRRITPETLEIPKACMKPAGSPGPSRILAKRCSGCHAADIR